MEDAQPNDFAPRRLKRSRRSFAIRSGRVAALGTGFFAAPESGAACVFGAAGAFGFAIFTFAATSITASRFFTRIAAGTFAAGAPGSVCACLVITSVT